MWLKQLFILDYLFIEAQPGSDMWLDSGLIFCSTRNDFNTFAAPKFSSLFRMKCSPFYFSNSLIAVQNLITLSCSLRSGFLSGFFIDVPQSRTVSDRVTNHPKIRLIKTRFRERNRYSWVACLEGGLPRVSSALAREQIKRRPSEINFVLFHRLEPKHLHWMRSEAARS